MKNINLILFEFENATKESLYGTIFSALQHCSVEFQIFF